MNKLKFGLLAAGLAVSACLLSGCGEVDDSIFESNANFSVNIAVPYSTTTPRPEHLNVPDQVVIDPNGVVTVNDKALLNSSYTRTKEDEDSGYQNLSLGDTGEAVQRLQQRLKDLNYFASGVSGIFDVETQTAVKRFEQSYGIMQTGIATAEFQTRLFSGDAPVYGSEAYDSAVVSQYTTLQRGATGSSVYALQHRLKELGYPIRELNGVYDEDTENAVTLFGESYGLESQTVAYIALQKELYSDTAIPYGSGQEPSAYARLSLGNFGTQVMKIQNRLIELGYLDGTANGVFDSETEAAVMLFENACGVSATGSLTTELQSLLLSDEAPAFGATYETDNAHYDDLSEGSSGEAVAQLQNRLIELGYAAGAGNGNYGTETATAVRMFQHYNGLPETGAATSDVQKLMYSPAALSYQDILDGRTPTSRTPAVTADPDEMPLEATRGPEPGAYVLKLNDSGEDVSKLQQRLNELGYECSTSGTYDESTLQAMQRFQAAVGMPQTGEAGDSTLKYIYTKAAPPSQYRMYNSTQDFTTLQEGDTGEAVTRLQQALWKLGYLLTEDVKDSVGTFHEATRKAVLSAQRAMGYEEPDGVATPEFQCFIFSDYNVNIKK